MSAVRSSICCQKELRNYGRYHCVGKNLLGHVIISSHFQATMTVRSKVDHILSTVVLPLLLNCPGVIYHQGNGHPHTV